MGAESGPRASEARERPCIPGFPGRETTTSLPSSRDVLKTSNSEPLVTPALTPRDGGVTGTGPLSAGRRPMASQSVPPPTLTLEGFMRLACRMAIIGALLCPLTATITQAQAPTITVGTLVYGEYRYQLKRD